jgi:hypothetical protein
VIQPEHSQPATARREELPLAVSSGRATINRLDQVLRSPNATRADVLSLATPKLATSQIAAVHLGVQAFWSKRPGSPGSGGASPYRAAVNKNPGLTGGF